MLLSRDALWLAVIHLARSGPRQVARASSDSIWLVVTRSIGQPEGSEKMSTQPRTILVFSHRPEVRESIVTAVGRRPAADIGRVTYVEADGVADVIYYMDQGGIDLAILDGEAQPTGGMGVCRQLKNELDDCPPIVIAVRRKDDRWLATWSQADAVLVHPLDPLTAAETVADVLRSHPLPVVSG
jgi:CheY-like chemotaxis protein